MLTQADYAAGEAVPLESIPDVLDATERGDVEVGFVAIENAIEGSVNVTLDALAFETDLHIQREVVIDVRLDLLALSGTAVADIHTVVSFPVAMAQCRQFLRAKLPNAETVMARSTAEAAQVIGAERQAGVAAIGTALAAELYDLEVIATDIEDHQGNQTRFVGVARSGIPPESGHDKTSIVVYQQANRPGSLLGILQEFAARQINLTRLESRPTKRGLGDYCFIIDLEGHIADAVVADCLRTLRAKQGDVKFLGSYPAAGDHGHKVRQESDENWRQADAWLADLRRGLTT